MHIALEVRLTTTCIIPEGISRHSEVDGHTANTEHQLTSYEERIRELAAASVFLIGR